MRSRYAIGVLYFRSVLRNFMECSHEQILHWQTAKILSSPPLSLSHPFSSANQTLRRRRFKLFPRLAYRREVPTCFRQIGKFVSSTSMLSEHIRERRLADPIPVMPIPYAHLKAVIRPGAEFHLAALIIKGKPGNVYLASALEYTGRHVQTGPIVLYDNVRRISAVKALVGAIRNNDSR